MLVGRLTQNSKSTKIVKIISIKVLGLDIKQWKAFNNATTFFFSIWVQLLDRRQKRLELALLAADQFIDVKSTNCSEDWVSWTPTVYVLYSQVSEIWINVHDILYFFPCEENCSTLSFIWATEETGWRHLYLITTVLTPPINGVAHSDHGDGKSVILSKIF